MSEANAPTRLRRADPAIKGRARTVRGEPRAWSPEQPVRIASVAACRRRSPANHLKGGPHPSAGHGQDAAAAGSAGRSPNCDVERGAPADTARPVGKYSRDAAGARPPLSGEAPNAPRHTKAASPSPTRESRPPRVCAVRSQRSARLVPDERRCRVTDGLGCPASCPVRLPLPCA